MLAQRLYISCGRLLAQEDRKAMSAPSIAALYSPGPGRIPRSPALSPLLIGNEQLCLPLAGVSEHRSELGNTAWVGSPRSALRAVRDSYLHPKNTRYTGYLL